MADRTLVTRLRVETGQFESGMRKATAEVERLDRASEENAKASGKAKDAQGKWRDETGRFVSAQERARLGLKNTNEESAKAVGSFDRLAKSARTNSQEWTTVGTSFAAVGAAIGVGVIAAVKANADFEQSMAQVRSATRETASNMDDLREAALQAGIDTKYSATEAAGAVEELAKAGVSTEAILNGGLTGALSLAAAGNLDVADAAEYAASAMVQFNRTGADVPHIADLLAAGAGKAQGSVDDLAQALNQSGLVAAQTGLTIEETTGGLAAFASAGLTGSDAGTSFKTMLQSLTPNSAAAAEAMADMGFSAYDADGNFVGLTEVAGQLQEGLSTMSQEQQNATLKTIFGSDAVRAAAVLYKQGAGGIQEWIDKTNDAGYAAETAAINMDTLNGDLEQLKGSLETALIGTGESATGPLRDLVQGLQGAVDWYNQLDESAKGVVMTTGGVVAGVGLLGGAFLTLTPKVIDAVDAVRTLKDDMPQLSGRMGKAASAAGIAAVAFGSLSAATALFGDSEDVGGVAEYVRAINDLGVEGSGAAQRLEELSTASGKTGGEVRGLADAVEVVNWGGFIKGADKVGGIFGDSRVEYATQALTRYDEALSTLVANGAQDQAAAGADHLREMVEAQGQDFDVFASEYLPAYDEALANAAAQQDAVAGSAAGMQGAVGGLPGAVESTFASLDTYAASLGYSEDQTDELRDASTELGESLLAFVDPLGTYTGLLQAKEEAERAAAEATAAATGDQSDAWSDYVGDVTVSVEEYLAQMERQVADQQNWQQNMLFLAGRVSQGTIDELARMGPEGAPLVADLVDASDDELARFDDVTAARAEDAMAAWGEKLTLAQPVLAQIAAEAGQGAAEAAARELAEGTKTIEGIAADYGIALADGINPVLIAIGARKVNVNQQPGRLYPGPSKYADGGFHEERYANGGMRENHVAQIAPAGAWRVWAENETGGEALPLLVTGHRLRLELAA